MRKPKPPMPGKSSKPYQMPTIKPGMPGMVKPPSMTKPPKPGSKPYPMPRVTDDMGMKEQAKKRALEMMMGGKR